MSRRKKKNRNERIKYIIDKALVALRDVGVREFTSLDVESKELELGYKYCPSKNHIAYRLSQHTKRGIIDLIRGRKDGVPNVWRFNNKSGAIYKLYLKRLKRLRDERSNSMNNAYPCVGFGTHGHKKR